MKNLKTLLLIGIASLFTACGSDDNGSGTIEPITGNYFPSSMDDLWIYNVENINDNDATLNYTGTDLLQVITSTNSNFTVQVNNGTSLAKGRMNTFLANGILSKTDDVLSYTGALGFPEVISEFSDATISLNNIALYDLNATNNQELSNTSGTDTEDLDLNGMIIPLTINYAITTTKLNILNNLTVDGVVYNNVTTSNLTLEMNITASIDLLGSGTPTDVSVFATQDVLSIDYSFAENIGLIKADADQGYVIDPSFVTLLELIPNFTFPLPTTATESNIQEIDSYVIN